MSERNQIPVAFITGSSRSGTTLLSNMLNAHSEIISCAENGFMSTHLHHFKGTGWSEAKTRKFMKHLWLAKRFYRSIWALNEDEILNELLQKRERLNFQEVAKTLYSKYQGNNKQAKIYIDKGPVYTDHLNAIHKQFPDSKFIVLVRDYRDRHYSLKGLKAHKKYKAVGLEGLSWYWHQQRCLRFEQEYPGKVLWVKYEALIENTDEVLNSIFDFLGVSQESLSDFHSTSPNFEALSHLPETENFAKSHQKSSKPIDPKNLGKGLKKLSEAELIQLENVCGGMGTKFGYERTTTGSGGGFKKFLSRMIWFPPAFFFRMPLWVQAILFKMIKPS